MELDGRLAALGRPPRARPRVAANARRPGAGAAGGTGFGLLCLAGPVPVAAPPTGHRARHGGDRFRRQARPRRPRRSPARVGSTPRPRSARRRSASPAGPRTPASRASRSAAGSSPLGSRPSRPLGVTVVPVVEHPQTVEEAIAAGSRRRSCAAASGSRHSSPSARSLRHHRAREPAIAEPDRRRPTPASRRAASKPKAKPKKRKRAKPNPAIAWARRLARYRPGLARRHPRPPLGPVRAQVWQRRLDPTSELVLTILTQSTADVNAETGVRRAPRRLSVRASRRSITSRGSAGAATACRTARRPTGSPSRPPTSRS